MHELAVSFVVIAFNERDHIEACLRAILSQEQVDIHEVIVVDDGSIDGTGEAVATLARSDPRVRLLAQANLGRGAARAAGVRAAQAPLIAFVDADVVIPHDWTRRCLAELPGHAAVGGIAVPDGHTAVLARVSGARPREQPGSLPITGANVLFAAGILHAFPFDPADRLGEDFRLAKRLLRAGYRLKRVDGLVARHEESKSFRRELAWRFQNGVDAASHLRHSGVRFPDLVFAGWLGAWVIGIAGTALGAPWLLALGVAASLAVGLAHAASRFHASPLLPFLVACLGDIPLMNANMVGRLLGLPGVMCS